MDVRIGVTYSPKELDLELDAETDRDELASAVEKAMSGKSPVLWLTDRRGRKVAVPAEKLAYVEIGGPEDDRRIGFGS